jgi:hypothetical protein
MAGGAVTQADKILGAHRLVTIQAPAHILTALRFGCGHPGQVTMAGLTIHPGSYMGLVVEADKIGLDGNRHPGNGLIAFDETGQFYQLRGFLGNLLVATPALATGR